eukprot:s1543_g6.t1
MLLKLPRSKHHNLSRNLCKLPAWKLLILTKRPVKVGTSLLKLKAALLQPLEVQVKELSAAHPCVNHRQISFGLPGRGAKGGVYHEDIVNPDSPCCQNAALLKLMFDLRAEM